MQNKRFLVSWAIPNNDEITIFALSPFLIIDNAYLLHNYHLQEMLMNSKQIIKKPT